MQELISQILSSSEIFDSDSSRTFTQLNQLSNAYSKQSNGKSDYTSVHDNNDPFDLMAKIIACSITNKNLIIDPEVDDDFGKVNIEKNQLINFKETTFHDINIGIKTSGSSGAPKTIILSLSSLLNNAELVSSELGFDQGKTWYLSLPTYHVAAYLFYFDVL